ncbi:hypothetical protein JCM10213_002679 [Rhodosporidiobolus nylandii]
MLPLPPLAALSLLLAAASSPLAISAAVLPAPAPRSKSSAPAAASWCTPRFSGLVQEIRKSGEADMVWKAVASKPGPGSAMDGVKAAKLGKSRSAALELEYEWFVENGDQSGVFSISTGAAPSACLSTGFGHNPLEVQEQRAFSPSSLAASSCAPSHSFRILCSSCDPHEDSAAGCFLQSVSKGLCVELLPPAKGAKKGRAHLGWGECAWDKKEEEGWRGREEKDTRRQRQLWDIQPS